MSEQVIYINKGLNEALARLDECLTDEFIMSDIKELSDQTRHSFSEYLKSNIDNIASYISVEVLKKWKEGNQDVAIEDTVTE